jgi:hypothetical protein
MEVDMELTKKTTILFSPALYEHLTHLARQRGVSVGELVRSACENQYGFVDPLARLEAVQLLGSLSLPVGPPSELKRQSVPSPDSLLP